MRLSTTKTWRCLETRNHANLRNMKTESAQAFGKLTEETTDGKL